jgi:hypothetical protein
MLIWRRYLIHLISLGHSKSENFILERKQVIGSLQPLGIPYPKMEFISAFFRPTAVYGIF